MRKILTLCVVYNKEKILLGMKKRGFGEGKWNGFGGKVDDGESVESGAIRELEEESGIVAIDIEKRGVLDFDFCDHPEILEVHLFSVSNFNGDPQETEEMNPKWFNLNEIPYDEMWPDDKHWLPLILDGKKFKGMFCFDKNNNIIDYKLEEIDEI